ncbi:Heavy metal-associated domain, HMA [Dillenia turbinata]|uniref:Heavy metal-associated domain, HMA n=1 Tax=Dillenia turbinata TaxID=194707 RepID=A0AAN8Z834_9MAGN
MKKVVLKVDAPDEKTKQKVMKAVSGLSGLQSLSMDLKAKKLTAVGDVDPVKIVSKVRKFLYAEIESVEAVKSDKKDEGKKDDGKKDDGGKKDGDKDKKDPVAEYLKLYQQTYHPAFAYPHYYVRSAEEDPNSCVIC